MENKGCSCITVLMLFSGMFVAYSFCLLKVIDYVTNHKISDNGGYLVIGYFSICSLIIICLIVGIIRCMCREMLTRKNRNKIVNPQQINNNTQDEIVFAVLVQKKEDVVSTPECSSSSICRREQIKLEIVV